jgi:hypothetical protein
MGSSKIDDWEDVPHSEPKIDDWEDVESPSLGSRLKSGLETYVVDQLPALGGAAGGLVGGRLAYLRLASAQCQERLQALERADTSASRFRTSTTRSSGQS